MIKNSSIYVIQISVKITRFHELFSNVFIESGKKYIRFLQICYKLFNRTPHRIVLCLQWFMIRLSIKFGTLYGLHSRLSDYNSGLSVIRKTCAIKVDRRTPLSFYFQKLFAAGPWPGPVGHCSGHVPKVMKIRKLHSCRCIKKIKLKLIIKMETWGLCSDAVHWLFFRKHGRRMKNQKESNTKPLWFIDSLKTNEQLEKRES